MDGNEITGSLARGIAILHCFVPGRDLLSHTEISELTGLPKSTVSRLTTALLRTGFLIKVPDGRFSAGYAVLSLMHSSLSNCQFIDGCRGEVDHVTQFYRANIGVSVPCDTEMLYIFEAYGDDTRASRRIVPGLRKRLESNAIGHAYIASLSEQSRSRTLERLQERHPETWQKYEASIARSLVCYAKSGYCELRWQHGTISFATPFMREGRSYVVNISVSDTKERTAASLRSDVIGELKNLGNKLACV